MNLFIYTSDPSSACGFWRATSPFTLIPGAKISQSLPSIVDFFTYDVFIYCRPSTSSAHESILQANALGKPTVVDWDDLWWDIPHGNLAREGIAKQARQIEACCLACRAFTVSTDALYVNFRQRYSKQVFIHPNAWDDRFLKLRPKELVENQYCVRGGISHIGDYDAHRDTLMVMRNKGASFIWLGYRPHWASMDDHVQWSNLIDYFTVTLTTLAPEYLMVLLEENEFNRCKSNIALMESVVLGAKVIRPVPRSGLYDTELYHRDSFDSVESINKQRLSDFASL